MNYYNEYDPKTAAWLRELIKVGAIPDGHVDERSIAEVSPDDLRGFTQCHFFAGIGGWSLALQLAGWSSERPVWTGSCPCQPFSAAGKGLGAADERHLWPVFFELIRQCRPKHVFGEQVASAIGHGWLDGVSADLEAEGYACGATVLGAHSVGAPHIRQRLYWVANSKHSGLQGYGGFGEESVSAGWKGAQRHGAESGAVSGLAHDSSKGLERSIGQSLQGGSDGFIGSSADGGTGRVGDSNSEQTDSTKQGQQVFGEGLLRCWDASRLVHCRDGKTRRIPSEPAFFPLADGIPARVVRLRGYGNAIVPQVAAEFIGAFMDTTTPSSFPA